MNSTSINSVDRFAAEATCFREWALTGTDTGDCAARQALLRISGLYLAALDLPRSWSAALADEPAAVGISWDECRLVEQLATRRIPFTAYARVFAPLTIPPEAAVIGYIADDIGEIYSDVVGGGRSMKLVGERKLYGNGHSLCDRTGDNTPQTRSARCITGLLNMLGINSLWENARVASVYCCMPKLWLDVVVTSAAVKILRYNSLPVLSPELVIRIRWLPLIC